MFLISHMQLLRRAAIVLGTNCALAVTVAGQGMPSKLPAECALYASVPLSAEAGNVRIPKTSPACASYRSYRGIGRPVNYANARSCAWQERLGQQADLGQNLKEPTAWVVGGSLILADIYFNGAGVERDPPLAVRFACESEEGMAMLALPDITKLNGSPPAHGPFEFCDYAATTITMNFCGEYMSEIEDDRKNRYYRSLKSSMAPEQKAAFEKLLAAENAYVAAHAFEVDQGGSIRNLRTLGSESILNNLFHTEIVHFERKKWPVLSSAQVTTADASLRRHYEKVLKALRAQTKEDIDEGGVTADHLADVERKWETYRDAWVVFARLRYSAAVAAIRAEVTLRRFLLLKTIR